MGRVAKGVVHGEIPEDFFWLGARVGARRIKLTSKGFARIAEKRRLGSIVDEMERRCAHCDAPMECKPEGNCCCGDLPHGAMPQEARGRYCPECLREELRGMVPAAENQEQAEGKNCNADERTASGRKRDVALTASNVSRGLARVAGEVYSLRGQRRERIAHCPDRSSNR